MDGQRVKEVPGWGKEDVPGKTEQVHLSEPDTTTALPIALGLVDPRSPLARKTLDRLDELWNARWSGGGYERYHSSAQGDQPGPWPFASCFVMRAQHEAGLLDRSRRTLDWLNRVPGRPRGGVVRGNPAGPLDHAGHQPGPRAKSACSWSGTCWACGSKGTGWS